MPLLGAHMSVAGGYYKAVEAAADHRMDCVQIFTKNNNQWRAAPLLDDDVARFQQSLSSRGIRAPCAHASYLINLASPDPALWTKSLDAFVVELERAERLGLLGLVVHPGSHMGQGEYRGIRRIAKALNAAHRRTKGFAVRTWLETTAGQGTSLGHRFEHLSAIRDRVKEVERSAVCVDSCHIFAAGYALESAKEYTETIGLLDESVGLDNVAAFHLNDSKRELGSRVDRHEHIGKGHLGLTPFRRIVNDSRFAECPMYLETPKKDEKGRDQDQRNLATLRGLIRSTRRKTRDR